MRINNEQKTILDRAVRMYSDGMITIEQTKESGENVWGVNWCCCGAADLATAYKFAEDLKTAIKLADRLNEDDVVVDDDYTCTLDKDEAIARSVEMATMLTKGVVSRWRLLKLLSLQ